MQVLKTPESAFDKIPDFPYVPRYVAVTDTISSEITMVLEQGKTAKNLKNDYRSKILNLENDGKELLEILYSYRDHISSLREVFQKVRSYRFQTLPAAIYSPLRQRRRKRTRCKSLWMTR